MKTLRKTFGIVSWLPSKEPDRSLRAERLGSLMKFLNDVFGNQSILVIAQNWKGFDLPEPHDNVKEIRFDDGLGITGARKTLIDEFLKTDGDYLIMLDDDALIRTRDHQSASRFLKAVDEHPDGFMFRLNKDHSDYDVAQLNMCAVSRAILEKQGMVDIKASEHEGFEDCIYSHLLHYKYPMDEWHFDETDVWCSQFYDGGVPSTWYTGERADENAIKTAFFVEAFKNGRFDIDGLKEESNRYYRRKAFYDRALFNGWINREDIGKTC